MGGRFAPLGWHDDCSLIRHSPIRKNHALSDPERSIAMIPTIAAQIAAAELTYTFALLAGVAQELAPSPWP